MEKSIYNWYVIPGFSAYEINIHDKHVRSNKHFNKMSHHIMKVKSNTVRIVDDFGVSRRVDLDYLYDITFNSGNKLRPRGDNEVYKSGMLKGARNSIAEVLEPEEQKYVTLDFYGMALGKPDLVKPFTIDLDRN